MTRRPLAALFLAVTALAACRQIIGLDDRPGLHDAGSPLVVGPDARVDADAGVDSGPVATYCTSVDASFCDDFENAERDAGWVTTIDDVDDGGPPVGTVLVGDDGRNSAHALHTVGSGSATSFFHNARLVRSFPVAATRVVLAFALNVHSGFVFQSPNDRVQLALVNVPGALVFPVLGEGGLFLEHTTADGGEVEEGSAAPLALGTWHRMTIIVEGTADRSISVMIDDAVALPRTTFLPTTDVGTVDVALGLRFYGSATAIDVRYDDVTIDVQ